MNAPKGTGVALVTPFTKHGELDLTGLDALLQHVRPHVDYVVVCGTTGETPTLSKKEQLQVLDFVLGNAGNLPVYFGVGGNNTNQVLKDIRSVPDRIAGILSVSPPYSKPSQEGIIAHFTAIADTSPFPVILYNVPGRTGSNMEASTTITLSVHPNIIAIKEASGNLEQCRAIARDSDHSFSLISGDDLMTPDLLKIGGIGVISVLANALPAYFKELIEGSSIYHFRQLSTINELMYLEGNPVGIKELLRQLGVCNHFVRLPHVAASKALQQRIAEELPKL